MSARTSIKRRKGSSLVVPMAMPDRIEEMQQQLDEQFEKSETEPEKEEEQDTTTLDTADKTFEVACVYSPEYVKACHRLPINQGNVRTFCNKLKQFFLFYVTYEASKILTSSPGKEDLWTDQGLRVIRRHEANST